MAHDEVNEGYARALFEIAQAEGVVDRVEEELFQLRELLKTNGKLLEFLKDANIKREGKREALTELFEGRVHSIVLNALMTISDQDRARRLLSVIEEYSSIAAGARERVSGEVVTAVPLDDATVRRMAKELSRITGKNVQLFQKLDRSILGGAIIKVGEQIIDGSLRRKLEQIKEQMTRS